MLSYEAQNFFPQSARHNYNEHKTPPTKRNNLHTQQSTYAT